LAAAQMCTSFFFLQAEDGIRDDLVTGVQTCALPIWDIVIRRRETAIGTSDAPAALLEPCEGARRAFVQEMAIDIEQRLPAGAFRSEERRVGKECRSRGPRCHHTEVIT